MRFSKPTRQVLRPRFANVRTTSHVRASTSILLQLMGPMSAILIAAHEPREHKTPSDAPKEQPGHIAIDLSSTPGREPDVQDLRESEGQGTVAGLQHDAPAEQMPEGDPVGEGAHEPAQSGGSG